MELVTALEFSKYVERKLAPIVTEADLKEIPWPPKALSDHRSVELTLEKYGTFVTLNTLNPKWLNYIVDDDGSGQRLKHCWFANPDNKEERLNLITSYVIRWVFEENAIVCLQEVGPELWSKLFAIFPLAITIRTTKLGQKDNWNVTIWDPSNYTASPTQSTPLDPEQILEGAYFILFENHLSKNQFYVLNVHIPFKKNNAIKQLLEKQSDLLIPKNLLILVCGDFNASSRYPPLECMDHITIYDGDRFRFVINRAYEAASPDDSRWLVTHSNLFKNAGSSDKQLDAFDHLALMNWKNKF